VNAAERVTPRPTVASRVRRWIAGPEGKRWGSDPGAYDPDAVTRILERVEPLFGDGRYFGLDAQGWDNIPPAPAMFVSNHSGGTTIPDVWGLGVAWYRHFGGARPIHPMAHEIILSTRATGTFFGRLGVLRAERGLAVDVLRTWRRDLLVMPGGDLDTWRPYSRRYRVCFGGRTGYARMALRARVPIVPVANAGAHQTLIVLSDGQRIARALRLPQLARASIFPIHLSLPWGLTIGPWPHLPTPTTLRYRFGPPILPPATLAQGEEPSDELVAAHDRRVRAAVQVLLDGLAHDARRGGGPS
jgi:1-acyl-sn-glycerol-3-phosphate acyltransferase